jgi:hypothetical protein
MVAQMSVASSLLTFTHTPCQRCMQSLDALGAQPDSLERHGSLSRVRR